MDQEKAINEAISKSNSPCGTCGKTDTVECDNCGARVCDKHHILSEPSGFFVCLNCLPVVRLIGEDGNAYAIMGRVERALKKAGLPDLVKDYIAAATSGDYENLLRASMLYSRGPDDEPDDEEADA